MAPEVVSAPQLLRKADGLRAKISSIKDEEFSLGSELWMSCQSLQDVYKLILLTDLEYALDKKVEQDLWHSTFKSHIDSLRLQTKEKKGAVRNEIQALLTVFLEYATGFYLQLLQELCVTYELRIPGRLRSSQLGILTDAARKKDNNNKRPHTSSSYYVCQDCLVHLGDVARYQGELSQAETFYQYAQCLVPSNGQPYNQLAILASSRGDELGTVYYYCRSVCVKNPFPAASTNLHKTLSKACSMINTSVENSKQLSKAEFFHSFIQFHGHVYLVQDLEEAQRLKAVLISSIKDILEKSLVSCSELVEMMAINLFTLYHCKHSGGTDPDDLEALSKDELEYWNLSLEFAMEFFESILAFTLEKLSSVESLEDVLTLPAVHVFGQWLISQPASSWKDEDLTAKRQLWRNFAVFLNILDKKTQVKTVSGMPVQEDWELQGFLPVRVVHRKLDFSYDREPVADPDKVRAQNLLHFGHWIVVNSLGLLEEDNGNDGIRFVLEEESQTPRVIGVDETGQKLVSSLSGLQLNNPEHGTPFTETSSLFRGNPTVSVSVDTGIPPSPSLVGQYSLFQSGWNVPLTSTAFTSGSDLASPTNSSSKHSSRSTSPDSSAIGSGLRPSTSPTSPSRLSPKSSSSNTTVAGPATTRPSGPSSRPIAANFGVNVNTSQQPNYGNHQPNTQNKKPIGPPKHLNLSLGGQQRQGNHKMGHSPQYNQKESPGHYVPNNGPGKLPSPIGQPVPFSSGQPPFPRPAGQSSPVQAIPQGPFHSGVRHSPTSSHFPAPNGQPKNGPPGQSQMQFPPNVRPPFTCSGHAQFVSSPVYEQSLAARRPQLHSPNNQNVPFPGNVQATVQGSPYSSGQSATFQPGMPTQTRSPSYPPPGTQPGKSPPFPTGKQSNLGNPPFQARTQPRGQHPYQGGMSPQGPQSAPFPVGAHAGYPVSAPQQVPYQQGGERPPQYPAFSFSSLGVSPGIDSGVWGPVTTSVSSSPGMGMNNLQSIWGGDSAPPQGMSPLEHLLQQQQQQHQQR